MALLFYIKIIIFYIIFLSFFNIDINQPNMIKFIGEIFPDI